MDWTSLLSIIQEGENSRLEFKESGFLKSPHDEIAADIGSFANRYGGKILVGVRDDGKIEGATIGYENSALDIQNIAINNCSPPIDLNFDFATSPEGDVLVIVIQKRKGIPHAIVHRKGWEIRSRTYYIRSGKRKQLIDDTTLQFLFQNLSDPYLSVATGLTIWYDRSHLVFSIIDSPSYMFQILPFVPEIKDNSKKSILIENEFDNIQKLILEVLPYAFLRDLSITFFSSWLVKTEKMAVVTTTSALRTDLPSVIFNSGDVPTNKLDILSKPSIDVRSFFYQFKLPESTEIEIQTESEIGTKQSILRLRNPHFIVTIGFTPVVAYQGLPSVIEEYFLQEDNDKFRSMFATQSFMLNFESKFSFPDKSNLLFEEHYEFAHTIYTIIRDRWNWDVDMKLLKYNQIKRINSNVMKILSIIEKNKENPK